MTKTYDINYNGVDPHFKSDAQSYAQDFSEAAIKNAWDIYKNAYTRKEQFLIVGRHSVQHFDWGASEASLKSIIKDSTPIPVGIVMKKPDGEAGDIVVEYKTMNEIKDKGAILDSSQWTILLNDAWLLGGINSGKQFVIVSPMSWYNLWTKKKMKWEKWYAKRVPGESVKSDSRMSVTARELIGLKDVAGFNVKRRGPHLIHAHPKSTSGFVSLAEYHKTVLNYTNQADPYTYLRDNFFKKLDRNLTFHASPHLIIDGKLTTAQEYLDEHIGKKSYNELHRELIAYDPQGAMLEQANPEGPYTMDDLNRGLSEVFASNPNDRYVLDFRGANLSNANPYADPNSKISTGLQCYLNCMLTDFSGSVFTDKVKLNILFEVGLYNGTDFSGSNLSGLYDNIDGSNYDDTTSWGNFNPIDQGMEYKYDPNAMVYTIY